MRLFSAESTHWYTRQGRAMHTVLDREGRERPTTIRDARRLLLLPSVTNILGIISRDSLTDWKMEQAVLAALTLPRGGKETLDEFAQRVAMDARSRLAAAQRFGVEFHAAAEQIAQNPLDVDAGHHLADWLLFYRDWFAENCVRLVWVEHILVSKEWGYAGMGDLCMVHRKHGLSLWDIKTQYVEDARLPRVRGTWLYQLAAYQRALGGKMSVGNLIVNSRMPAPVQEHVWSADELNTGWGVFKAAHLIWRNEKGYNPIVDSGSGGAAGTDREANAAAA